jgi:hypothetical protein
MRRFVLALTLAAPMASPTFAQDAETMTCAQFGAMTSDAQMQVLSTLQPFGDDMEPSDQAASEQWTATVAGACTGHPDRLVSDAAREAMGD